ncbi:hypothetical protein COB55_02670 [Candidatus Wolfebacteria bacterium]|nr:MAG: hypothetical protein COB55_02670 [Candidatus Wolfebacteria bacterium]
MSYHFKSSVHRPKHRLRYVALFLIVIGIMFYIAPPAFLTRLAHSGALPFWSAGNGGSDIGASIVSLSKSKKSIIKENQTLKEQVRDMQLRLLDRNLLREENIELKEMLGRSIDEKSVLARVLTKPNRSAYDTLVIDVGTDDHISKGDMVLVGDSIPIGKISEVFGSSAIVVLFSSPGEKVDVSIGTSGIVTEATGRGAGNFAIEIPRDIEISIGDIIVAPSISEKMFGNVEELYIDPAHSFKTVLFKSPINIFQLRWVNVLTNSIEIIVIE